MINKILAILFLGGCIGCQAQEKVNEQVKSPSKYLRWVGDSKFDPALDDKEFKTCYGDKVAQYFNFSTGLQYKGEKKAIWDTFQEAYQVVEKPDQNGMIRIRFIVNCEGKTGRFRVIGMNKNYQEKTFDKAITDQLLEITQHLDGWQLLPNAEEPRDYYQYLLFKMNKGTIVEILP